MSGALLLPSLLGAAGTCARPCSRRRRPCLASASTVATEGGSDVTDESDDDELDLQLLDEALRRQRTRDVGERESTIGNGIARLIFDNLREVSLAPQRGSGGAGSAGAASQRCLLLVPCPHPAAAGASGWKI